MFEILHILTDRRQLNNPCSVLCGLATGWFLCPVFFSFPFPTPSDQLVLKLCSKCSYVLLDWDMTLRVPSVCWRNPTRILTAVRPAQLRCLGIFSPFCGTPSLYVAAIQGTFFLWNPWESHCLASPVGYRYPYTLDVSVVVVALGPLFHISVWASWESAIEPMHHNTAMHRITCSWVRCGVPTKALGSVYCLNGCPRRCVFLTGSSRDHSERVYNMTLLLCSHCGGDS